MALKPGQTKEIAVQFQKIENLNTLKYKLDDMLAFGDNIDSEESTIFSKKLQAQIKKVEAQINKEVAELRAKIKSFKAAKKPGLSSSEDKKLAATIAKECSNYLAAFKKTKRVLFRGMDEKKMVFVGRSWNNRRPKDSNPAAQIKYDNVLKSMGIKALRSNSIFTTSDYNHASKFGGSVYLIFPKNTAVYSWSKTKIDIVLRFPKMVDPDIQKRLFKEFEHHLIDKNMESYKIDDVLWKLNKVMGNTAEAKKLLVRYKFVPSDGYEILDQLVTDDAIKKIYQPTNTDLNQALTKAHEVMIAGEYYAVKESPFARALLAELGLTLIKYKNFGAEDDYDD